MPCLIGLTGGIGAGKSLVAKMFAKLGATVLDADQLSREIVQPGSRTLGAVVEAFGEQILDSDRALDRARLACEVFADRAKRRRLEAIMHPAIARAFAEKVDQLSRNGIETVVYEASLLIETGAYERMDWVVVVVADDQVRVERICRRDRLDRQAAIARLAAQLPQQDKVALGDFVIENSGSVATTRRQVEQVWQQICASGGDDDA